MNNAWLLTINVIGVVAIISAALTQNNNFSVALSLVVIGVIMYLFTLINLKSKLK